MKKFSSLRSIVAACFLALLYALCGSAFSQGDDIPAAQLVQPAALVKMLDASGSDKPLVLQVGSHVLYTQAHVPGSEYVGAAGEASGLKALRDRVKGLDHARFIVIYCGCCPWRDCPNIRAADRELSSLGFTHVKALYLANNFGTDWVSKGFPAAKGQ